MKKLTISIFAVVFSFYVNAQSRQSIVNDLNQLLLDCYKYEHESLTLENNVKLTQVFGNGTRWINISDIDSYIKYDDKDSYYFVDLQCKNGGCLHASWSESTYDNFGFDVYTKHCAENIVAKFRKLINTPANNYNNYSSTNIKFVKPYNTNGFTETSSSYIDVKVKVEVPAGVSYVKINNSNATNDGYGNYRANIKLDFGDNIITAVVTDKNYKKHYEAIQVRRKK